MKRGWEARHQEKLNIKKLIIDKAKKEIKKISQRDLWLIGTALYWAEGSKEKDKSSQVTFGNSDPKMVIIFLKWLNKICKIKKKDIIFRVYLHENSENRLKEVKKYWSRIVGFSEKHFKNVSWKRNKISTNRKNIGKKYYGLLSITVRKSTNLNRKIQGWVDGIFNNCRVV
ncbi:MAG: hypothetical protein PHH50_01350 [Candidatus Pacebacteria bacterium]|nr:hypothetical protein [Candidatus Paceibacterota bacterium]